MDSAIVWQGFPTTWPDELNRVKEVSCDAQREFNEFLKNLPMAAPYKPFTSIESSFVAVNKNSNVIQ